MKRFWIISAIVATVAYIIFAIFYFGHFSSDDVCTGFEVIVKDSDNTRFVQTEDIVNLVKRKGLYPEGKPLTEINTLAIRDTILTNRLVKEAKVYTTSKGGVVASITQRRPVLRVIPDNGSSFYIDNNRQRMPISSNYTVYVPLATGAITEEFAKGELYEFARFLSNNQQWDAWVEQIVVRKGNDVAIVPRIGDFLVVLGSLEGYEEKLSRFALFAEKGLSVVGWNRYSAINLKYDNQVVCTKR